MCKSEMSEPDPLNFITQDPLAILSEKTKFWVGGVRKKRAKWTAQSWKELQEGVLVNKVLRANWGKTDLGF